MYFSQRLVIGLRRMRWNPIAIIALLMLMALWMGPQTVNAASDDGGRITLRGVIEEYTDDNDFVIQSDAGRFAVDLGESPNFSKAPPAGTEVTVTGVLEWYGGMAEIDACQIQTATETIYLRDCEGLETEAWENDRDSLERATRRNWDDDFYGTIEARPEGTAGTWLIGGRGFDADVNTRLSTDDGPLMAGTCVSVDIENGRVEEIESESPGDCAQGGGWDDTSDLDDDFYGIIEQRPGGIGGAWVIGGRTFQADIGTFWAVDDGPLTPGACVSVEYEEGGRVFEIESESMADCLGMPDDPDDHTGGDDDFYGILESRPEGIGGAWVVNGQTFMADMGTFWSVDDGPLSIGACVSVDTEDGRVYEIESESMADCLGMPDDPGDDTGGYDDFYGILESRPEGIGGVWVVNGQTFMADMGTFWSVDDGPLSIGACVSVDTEDGRVYEIESESMADCLGMPDDPGDDTGGYDDFYGILESRPEGIGGAWVVNGQTFMADVGTFWSVDDGPLSIGACVSVDTEDGRVYEIETEPLSACFGGGDDPSDDYSGDDWEDDLYGILESRPMGAAGVWVVGGYSFEAGPEALLVADDGPISIGVCVSVDFEAGQAIEIESEDGADCGGDTPSPPDDDFDDDSSDDDSDGDSNDDDYYDDDSDDDSNDDYYDDDSDDDSNDGYYDDDSDGDSNDGYYDDDSDDDSNDDDYYDDSDDDSNDGYYDDDSDDDSNDDDYDDDSDDDSNDGYYDDDSDGDSNDGYYDDDSDGDSNDDYYDDDSDGDSNDDYYDDDSDDDSDDDYDDDYDD